MSVLTVKGLRKAYKGQDEILKNIDFSVAKGECIAILGPSGGGKTTFLRCLNFLEPADAGEMIFDGQCYDMSKMSGKDIIAIRKRTSFVFQSFNLFLNKTALQNVMEGLVTARHMDKAEAGKLAASALEQVGLADRMDYYPNQLSGGQQQRVAIARAIVTDPDIIYFDEPTSALDPELTEEILNTIRQLAGEGRTMIIVTHETDFARQIASRIFHMQNGVLAEENNIKQEYSG